MPPSRQPEEALGRWDGVQDKSNLRALDRWRLGFKSS